MLSGVTESAGEMISGLVLDERTWIDRAVERILLELYKGRPAMGEEKGNKTAFRVWRTHKSKLDVGKQRLARVLFVLVCAISIHCSRLHRLASLPTAVVPALFRSRSSLILSLIVILWLFRFSSPFQSNEEQCALEAVTFRLLPASHLILARILAQSAFSR